MTDDLFTEDDIVFTYTDEEAIEDGVLLPVSFGIINRVTRSIFDDFIVNGECDLARFNLFMDKAIKEFDSMRQKKDDWFYKIVIDDRAYFICENGSSYFTLMKPEDY